jgi:small subunit ribosomal protein S6
MRKYEIMYILKADLDETARKEVQENIHGILTSNGATITNVDEKLGLRDLAYPINDEVKGFYVVIKVTSDETALKEFARLVRINANVLRHLVVVDHE